MSDGEMVPLTRKTEDAVDAEYDAVMRDLNPNLCALAAENSDIRDATPCWAKLDWANGEIARLQGEIGRRDVVLRWLAANTPAALELCPYKARLDTPAEAASSLVGEQP